MHGKHNWHVIHHIMGFNGSHVVVIYEYIINWEKSNV